MDPGAIFTIDKSCTVTCLLDANHYLPHHTFNPLLQQTGELDSLTDSLGQSLEFVLCGSPRCLQHLCDGLITSVSTERRLVVVLFTPCSWGSQQDSTSSTKFSGAIKESSGLLDGTDAAPPEH